MDRLYICENSQKCNRDCANKIEHVHDIFCEVGCTIDRAWHYFCLPSKKAEKVVRELTLNVKVIEKEDGTLDAQPIIIRNNITMQEVLGYLDYYKRYYFVLQGRMEDKKQKEQQNG